MIQIRTPQELAINWIYFYKLWRILCTTISRTNYYITGGFSVLHRPSYSMFPKQWQNLFLFYFVCLRWSPPTWWWRGVGAPACHSHTAATLLHTDRSRVIVEVIPSHVVVKRCGGACMSQSHSCNATSHRQVESYSWGDSVPRGGEEVWVSLHVTVTQLPRYFTQTGREL